MEKLIELVAEVLNLDKESISLETSRENIGMGFIESHQVGGRGRRTV